MVIGIFLKLHIMEKTVRRYIVPIHSILGKAFPLVGWTRMSLSYSVPIENAELISEMLMGVATALNFCRGGELGQCLAHYIMGSAFIAYAVLLVIMLNFGGKWLQRRGCSQELLDSSVIMVWVSHIMERYQENRLTWSRESSTHLPSTMVAPGRIRTCNIPCW